MKKTTAGAACVLLLAAAAVATDDPTRVWSDPALPSREALDRLNLEMAWSAYVPMDGKRDGFASIQLDGSQVIVQTRSGMITVLDADNGGRALWRARPGRPYQAVLPPAFNARGVFANDSGAVYALDRETGSLQWKYELRVALSAPLSVDDHQIYIENVEARLIAARLPEVSKPPAEALAVGPTPLPEGEKKPTTVAQGAAITPEEARPFIAFDYDTNQRVENKAVLSKDTIFLAIPSGSYLGVPKAGDNRLGNQERYRFSGDSRFVAPPAHSETEAYVATQDAHVYAIEVDTGKLLWRYIPGRPLARAPVAVDVGEGAAVDKDLYVTAEGSGLARLNRDTGESVWSIRGRDFSPEADRFLAANPKFVYATDGAGRLLVLDRKNGAMLSRYDVKDYVFPVINAETDRLCLAANDGLIVCLHDKSYPQALSYHRTIAPPEEKPLAERVQAVKDALAKPISDAGGETMTFKAYRDKIAKDYGLKVFVSNKAFKDMKLDPPDEQKITTPKADNRPLSDALNEVLSQVHGEYTQVEDTLIISPAKQK